MKKNHNGLTPREQQCLDEIVYYSRTHHGRFPTVRKIAELMGIDAISPINYYFHVLEGQGLISKDEDGHRYVIGSRWEAD